MHEQGTTASWKRKRNGSVQDAMFSRQAHMHAQEKEKEEGIMKRKTVLCKTLFFHDRHARLPKEEEKKKSGGEKKHGTTQDAAFLRHAFMRAKGRGKSRGYQLFVRLDVPNLAAVGTLSLRPAGVCAAAARARRCGRRAVGAGGARGIGRAGRGGDALCLVARQAATLVTLEACEFVEEAVRMAG